MARAYPVYAGITVATAFAAGALIDRVGAARLLPVFLLPISMCMTVLALSDDVDAFFLAFVFQGLGQGLVTGLFGSLWPELYGTRHLGSVRALAISAMVISTAVGPGVTGELIDQGVPFTDQGLWMAGYCLAVSVAFLGVARRIASERIPA